MPNWAPCRCSTPAITATLSGGRGRLIETTLSAHWRRQLLLRRAGRNGRGGTSGFSPARSGYAGEPDAGADRLDLPRGGEVVAERDREVREAVDFLGYYGGEIVRAVGHGRSVPLGPVVCISPWNFPLAILTGQVAAALAAGNTVLAKPAEETPLIAAEAVRILHEAGIPSNVLQVVPGAGEVGAALVADERVQGVMFTGSTLGRPFSIQPSSSRGGSTRAGRSDSAHRGNGRAERDDRGFVGPRLNRSWGDVIASAFDSAGQRCSALRISLSSRKMSPTEPWPQC